MNEAQNKYLLDGKVEDKKTVQKYFDDWDKNTKKVEWVKISK